MPDSEAKKRWDKLNTTRINIKLQHKTDADILSHLEGMDNKQGEIKRLVRVALEYERSKSI